MGESRRLAMRRAHAGRCNYCTCGATPHGNGGMAAHNAMHARRGDGHWNMTYPMWCDVKAGRIPMPAPKNATPVRSEATITGDKIESGISTKGIPS